MSDTATEVAPAAGKPEALSKSDEPQELKPVQFFQNHGSPYPVDANLGPTVEKITPAPDANLQADGTPWQAIRPEGEATPEPEPAAKAEGSGPAPD